MSLPFLFIASYPVAGARPAQAVSSHFPPFYPSYEEGRFRAARAAAGHVCLPVRHGLPAGIPEGPSRTLERVADGGGINVGHRVPATCIIIAAIFLLVNNFFNFFSNFF